MIESFIWTSALEVKCMFFALWSQLLVPGLTLSCGIKVEFLHPTVGSHDHTCEAGLTGGVVAAFRKGYLWAQLVWVVGSQWVSLQDVLACGEVYSHLRELTCWDLSSARQFSNWSGLLSHHRVIFIKPSSPQSSTRTALACCRLSVSLLARCPKCRA